MGVQCVTEANLKFTIRRHNDVIPLDESRISVVRVKIGSTACRRVSFEGHVEGICGRLCLISLWRHLPSIESYRRNRVLEKELSSCKVLHLEDGVSTDCIDNRIVSNVLPALTVRNACRSAPDWDRRRTDIKFGQDVILGHAQIIEYNALCHIGFTDTVAI